MTVAAAPDRHARAWWSASGLRSGAALLGWWLLGICTLTGSVMTTDARRVPGLPVEQPELSDLGVVVFLLGLLLLGLLVWRVRAAVPLAVVASLVAALVPLDPLVALVAGLHVVRRQRVAVAVPVAALVTVSTVVVTWRDLQGRNSIESLWRLFAVEGTSAEAAARDQGAAPWWVPVTIGLVVSAVFLGAGALRRVLERSAGEVTHQRAVAADLGDRLAAQDERERIAREVHDVIGHRLSVVSLHAAALEAHAPDGELGRSASLVREAAGRTAEDLRSLVSVLRDGSSDITSQVPGIADVEGLVDDAVAHGMTVVATVSLHDGDHLDVQTSQTSYRVVQEMLTNARRHAPTHGVRLVVRARSADGVLLEAANHVPQGREVHPGAGLTGMRERVELLGGELRLLVEDDVLRVVVHLPWRWQS
ncbi:sensor histidine kinase [Janibacter melonis]|uniref:sensor histidine kinase n=1 Tax=Janibacter melonis TaxID=262209 RepID=UPI001917C5F8|nr:histidine kinase [Janibacter melonis]